MKYEKNFSQKKIKMGQDEKISQIHVEGDLNRVGLNEAEAEEFSKKIAYAVVMEMTISEEEEIRKQGFEELYRMARYGYVPAIASVGLLYILRGKNQENEDFSLLGKRLCKEASDRGHEKSGEILNQYPELNDIVDDGRHLDYPDPGGAPMPIMVHFHVPDED